MRDPNLPAVSAEEARTANVIAIAQLYPANSTTRSKYLQMAAARLPNPDPSGYVAGCVQCDDFKSNPEPGLFTWIEMRARHLQDDHGRTP